MKKMNRKGFTIVELVIVIAVIAILAGVLIPTFSGIVSKAQESAKLQEVKNAMTNYLVENDGFIAEGTKFAYLEDATTGTDTLYVYTYSKSKLGDTATKVTGTYVKAVADDTTTTDIDESQPAKLMSTDETPVKLYTLTAINDGDKAIANVWIATTANN